MEVELIYHKLKMFLEITRQLYLFYRLIRLYCHSCNPYIGYNEDLINIPIFILIQLFNIFKTNILLTSALPLQYFITIFKDFYTFFS